MATRIRLELTTSSVTGQRSNQLNYRAIAIVTKLETGDVALEDAIAEFQKGMALSKNLQKTLEDAEKTLVKVMQADGTETEMDA